MKVYVKINECDLEYEVNQYIEIVILKVLIAMNTDIPVENLRLAFNGSILDNHRKLSDYNIQDGNCLTVVPPTHEEQQKIGPPGNRVYIQTLLSRLKALK